MSITKLTEGNPSRSDSIFKSEGIHSDSRYTRVPMQLSSEEVLPDTAVKASKRLFMTAAVAIISNFLHFARLLPQARSNYFISIEQCTGHVQIKNMLYSAIFVCVCVSVCVWVRTIHLLNVLMVVHWFKLGHIMHPWGWWPPSPGWCE